MNSSGCRLGMLLLASMLAMATSIAAQDYRGKVQGSITDENGAAVPGAQVVLRNIESGVEVTRQTNDDGRYVFDFVDPGEYTVAVEHAGFKKALQEHVIVRVREVWSAAVVQPLAVRYAFNNNPRHPNLTNETGLPAAPFRTDDWAGPTDGKR